MLQRDVSYHNLLILTDMYVDVQSIQRSLIFTMFVDLLGGEDLILAWNIRRVSY